VIYTGLRKTPGFIARVAVDEDVDAVGLSLLSGSHKELVAETVRELAALDASDIPLFVGGTIPAEDRAGLKELGVVGIFTAEMSLDDVVTELARALV
jgi:methylmalonyl-CoA mutase C-terminal domain/subunit